MTAALAVEGLGVRYGSLVALDDVSWSVRPGEILGVIGPNGAGKSTCLAAATNSTRHTGRILLGGRDVSRLPTHRLAGLGLRRTHQQNAFFGELTVLENAVCVLPRPFAASLVSSVVTPWREMRTRERARAEAASLLLSTGIGEQWFDALPGDVPYGVQRLLSIALAYAEDVTVLMLDEPAAGIGGEDMRHLTQLLLRLRDEGLALVLIEHHMDLIMSVADRIVVLDRGRLLADGTPDEVRRNPEVLTAYLGGVAA